jgi:hypothetical protein
MSTTRFYFWNAAYLWMIGTIGHSVFTLWRSDKPMNRTGWTLIAVLAVLGVFQTYLNDLRKRHETESREAES